MRTHQRPWARTLLLVAAVCTTLATNACGINASPEYTLSQKTEQFDELMTRPDIDQAVARYEEMYAELRDELTEIVPALHWMPAHPMLASSCGRDFSAVNAKLPKGDADIKTLASWSAAGEVPDARWDTVRSAVDAIVLTYGFDSGSVTAKDRPGDRYLAFETPDGASIIFTSAVNTAIIVTTGCHLTAEAKRRGTPAPVPTY